MTSTAYAFFQDLLSDFPLKREVVQNLRQNWVSRAEGEVLEIGIGQGANLPYYSENVDELIGLDIDLDRSAALLSRIQMAPFRVGLLEGSATQIPFYSDTFDYVISTWCIGAMDDPNSGLREVFRVLKPGGKLVFVEFSVARGALRGKIQKLIDPVFNVIGGNRLSLQLTPLLAGAGFSLLESDTTILPGWKAFSSVHRGVAAKPLRVDKIT